MPMVLIWEKAESFMAKTNKRIITQNRLHSRGLETGEMVFKRKESEYTGYSIGCLSNQIYYYFIFLSVCYFHNYYKMKQNLFGLAMLVGKNYHI